MRRWGAVLCAAWCVIACAVIAVRVQSGRAFDTDIQTLLPQNALEPVLRAAIADAGEAASGRVAILVGGDDPVRASDAAADLERALTATQFYVSDSGQGQAMARWLFANRNALSCETDPSRFDAARVAQRADALLYAPGTPLTGQMLTHDPFLLTLQLGQCLAPPSGAASGTLVSGALNATAFRIDVQDAVTAAYDAWRLRWPDVTSARAGAVFYAADSTARTRNEIALIGGVSTLVILLLLFVCFRRIQAVVGAMAVTAAGAVGSLGAALLVFPQVHVLVFVFGSALIGITSDYALHYLATGPQTGWADPKERLKRVARPLAVCALATALGFASLAAFGIAVFNQVALFSAAGVLTAWWFTMTLLPLMDMRERKADTFSAWWAKLEAPFLAFRPRRWHAFAGAALLSAIGVAGLLRFDTLDDVRQFQARSPQLAAEEARIHEALGFSSSPTFLLSYGASADEARQREEAVLAAWPQAAVRDTLALSRFDPSETRRAENQAAVERDLLAPHLAHRVEQLGLIAAMPLAAEAAPLPPMLSALEGEAAGTHYLVAPLGAAAEGLRAQGEGARVVDPAARYSTAFSSFRLLATGAVAAALAVCALMVLLLYRRWRALIVLAAPAIGVLAGIALPSALGMPVSFFSVAALFVVIGAGIDHSVFLFEASETDGQAKELVVFLAALTTILSMGLLGLSATYPVASFGMVVAAGVTAAYLASFAPAQSGGKVRGHD